MPKRFPAGQACGSGQAHVCLVVKLVTVRGFRCGFLVGFQVCAELGPDADRLGFWRALRPQSQAAGVGWGRGDDIGYSFGWVKGGVEK